MRHNKKFNHLGRTKSHREAMLANMTVSLIKAKRINTTVAKAKALRVYAEPIINRAKEDTTNSRRIVFSYLQDKEAVKELFGDIAVKIANRPGGYLRILKLGQNRLAMRTFSRTTSRRSQRLVVLVRRRLPRLLLLLNQRQRLSNRYYRASCPNNDKARTSFLVWAFNFPMSTRLF